MTNIIILMILDANKSIQQGSCIEGKKSNMILMVSVVWEQQGPLRLDNSDPRIIIR